jgi:hypothetical protein
VPYSAGNRGLPVVEDHGIDPNQQRFRLRLLDAGDGRFEVLRRDDINHQIFRNNPATDPPQALQCVFRG